jgi:hypothetical protein
VPGLPPQPDVSTTAMSSAAADIDRCRIIPSSP